jgi:glycosyltransferase involved in cell wall biosynthesis
MVCEVGPMRLGVIVRYDRRGLAYQTLELARALDPAVVVAIDTSPIDPSAPSDPVPSGAIVTPWHGHNTSITVEAIEALASCDVVYSAETFYDPALTAILRSAGVRSVLHVNPELYRPAEDPDVVWLPTSWERRRFPDATVMPVPIPDHRIAPAVAGEGPAMHVAGMRAHADRNGTMLVLGALTASNSQWRIHYQIPVRPNRSRRPNLDVRGPSDDRWRMYDGASMLVMPRRYGGLCLPVLEAMARGLAVVMTDIPPNPDTWPIVPLPRADRVPVVLPGGRFDAWATNPKKIAAVVDGLMGDPAALRHHQEDAFYAARMLSWKWWTPKYLAAFEDAAG